VSQQSCVPKVAAFLVSEPARYMTGGVIRCDGGMIKSV
jgi:NAD(P)-dependent dehydrogenase (short-subunit alcohol dehydrogenase family)